MLSSSIGFHCSKRRTTRRRRRPAEAVQGHLEALDVVDDVRADGRQRKLPEHRFEPRLEELSARLRGDDVEPCVADEHRPGDRGKRNEPAQAAHRGPCRGTECEEEGDVEADPGQVVMLRDMA